MAESSLFQALHVNQVQLNLLELYEKIACEKGRVEILHSEGHCRCVLISKEELDGLERAIDLLSNHEEVRSLQASLTHLAVTVDQPSTPSVDN